MGETFLGAIPLEPEIRATSDAGTPIVAENPDSPHTKAYEDIAAQIIRRIG
jgi:ATP-binding protein involved in chromosome partitioning